MRYYIEMNKKMLRDFYISEVLPKNKIINKDNNIIYGYKLYNNIEHFNENSEFILEININLNKYRNIELNNSILVLETLYEEFIIIKNIYYTSERKYQDLLLEKKTLGDIKLVKKFRFIKIEYESKENLTDEINFSNRDLLYFNKINELNEKKDMVYDTLKGSIYMYSTINIENIFTFNQRKISKQICELKNELSNINNMHLSIKEKNKVTQIIYSYINKKNKKILNKKNKFYYINKDRIKLNKNIIDIDLLNKIINIILTEKIKLLNSKGELIENVIIGLGNLSKREGNNKIYNDCKIIYSLIIQDSINYSYDDINDSLTKYLYLALEYFNRLEILNEIIIEEKFEDYFLIYIFVGAILGYKGLSKVYSNRVKESDYFNIINYMCESILSDILKNNDLAHKYILENYNIIKKLTNTNSYYNLINKYCLHKIENCDFQMKIRGIQKYISVNGAYIIYLNSNETKYFNKEKINYKININSKCKFKSFKITNIEGKRLKEDEIVELNELLKNLLLTI